MTISITPSGAPLGAVVTGIDLDDPPDDAAFADIRGAFLRHRVIAIRDLPSDLGKLHAFGRRFGALVPHVLSQYHHPETEEVSVISYKRQDSLGRTTAEPAGAFWHSDLSYDANPSDATMLYGLEIPSKGGDTQFADMAAAYAALPDAIKDRIAGLGAVHRYGYNGGTAVVDLNDDQRSRHPDVEHPVVRTHRETGEKTLFVNPGFTVRIRGVEESENLDLLDALFEHALKPEFRYRHKWRRGELVVMDNRACMHCASGDYTERRTLWRMIVGGTG